MKLKFYLLTLAFFLLNAGFSQTWTLIATDNKGDGSVPAYLDGTKLEYSYDAPNDSLWFRVTVDTITTAHANTFGVNILVNIPGGGNAFNFWGAQNMDKYHKGITAWVTGTPPSNYTGTIGIFDSAGTVTPTNYKNLKANNLRIILDAATKTIILGLKRTDLISDASFTGNTITVKVAGAVGTNMAWNDDIYASTATMTLTKTSTGIKELISAHLNIFVYPNPARDKIFVNLGNAAQSINELVLFNSLGEIVITKRVDAALHQEMDIHNLPAGIYFIQCKGMNTQETKKITIY